MANHCDGHGTIVRERLGASGAYETPAGSCPGCTLCRFLDHYRVVRKAPCSCTTSAHPGWTEDENWEQPYRLKPGTVYERTEGDGLILCGWCDGDLWVWRDVTTPDGMRSLACDLLILAAELDG